MTNIGLLQSASALESFFNTVILSGGAVGGAVGGKELIKLNHPFDNYFNKNFKDLKVDIKNWSNDNPSLNN